MQPKPSCLDGLNGNHATSTGKTKMGERMSFTKAKAQYVHRYTMEHVPQWAKEQREDGSFYAPQYRTDQEWYNNTTFPGETGHLGDKTHCFSTNASWPLGKSLNNPPRF